jgi:two-component system phosphate regulon sensor histidine kinase PhoR
MSLTMSWMRRTPAAPAADAVAPVPGELGRAQAALASLQAAVACLDTAILVVDRDLHVVASNPAADRLWSLAEPAPGIRPRAAGLARLPEVHGAVQTMVRGDATEGEAWRRRLRTADGRTLDIALHRLPGGEGLVAARDVSESVRLETSRRDFVAALSHELRTPLTSIQGYAEMLQDAGLPDALRAESLDVILQNTARLSRLAQDLVTLSSLETGAYPFRFEPLEAAELARPALAVVAPLALEHGCELREEGLEPATLRGDRDALHRVLLNLLENAILHGRPPAASGVAPKVTLSGRREGDRYVLRVRDNGPGIGSADQPRVFERFYQIGAGHTHTLGTPRRGTGLGLAVVKHIVREHGGEAALHSALGEGSTFLVRLPLQDAGARQDGSAA